MFNDFVFLVFYVCYPLPDKFQPCTVAGGISYAEYSQEIQTAESSEKVSMLKSDALRLVEKLKCSQNSNHLYVYDTFTYSRYIICFDCLYIEIIWVSSDLFHPMIYIACHAANYHGNRKHTLELIHVQHVLCPVLCFYKNDLYLESRHKKLPEGVSVGGSFPLLYSLCSSASLGNQVSKFGHHQDTRNLVHFWGAENISNINCWFRYTI